VEEQITPGGIGTSAIKLTLVLAGTLTPRWRGASIVSWCAMTAIVVPPVLLVLSFYALGGAAARPY